MMGKLIIPVHTCPQCMKHIEEGGGNIIAEEGINTLLKTHCENCGYEQMEVRWGEDDGFEVFGSRIAIPKRSLECEYSRCTNAAVVKETYYETGRKVRHPCVEHATDDQKSAVRMIAKRSN